MSDIHLHYEDVPVYEYVTVDRAAKPSYKVTKMKFAKIWDENGKAVNDRSTIILDRKSTRLNSSHSGESRMPSSA